MKISFFRAPVHFDDDGAVAPGVSSTFGMKHPPGASYFYPEPVWVHVGEDRTLPSGWEREEWFTRTREEVEPSEITDTLAFDFDPKTQLPRQVLFLTKQKAENTEPVIIIRYSKDFWEHYGHYIADKEGRTGKLYSSSYRALACIPSHVGAPPSWETISVPDHTTELIELMERLGFELNIPDSMGTPAARKKIIMEIGHDELKRLATIAVKSGSVSESAAILSIMKNSQK